MPISEQSMKDLTRILTKLEELEQIAITGEIPEDEWVPTWRLQLTPYIVGGLLDLTNQLAIHVKQLQIEVLACQTSSST